MRSKWYELKDRAIGLRKQGISIRRIESKLGIPRSTLSGWFRDVVLTEKQKEKLAQDHIAHLKVARKKAVAWHNAQKKARMIEALHQAEKTLASLKTDKKEVLDLALAMLYLGEGFKRSDYTGIGNSNPLILKFFIAVLRHNYLVKIEDIQCKLHLRADQDSNSMKRYWSKELQLPLNNFKSAYFDQRTKGSKTYPTYKGVCVVRCGHVVIQRKLLALSVLFSEQVVAAYMGG
jgi:hypothetical protein